MFVCIITKFYKPKLQNIYCSHAAAVNSQPRFQVNYDTVHGLKHYPVDNVLLFREY